jgi:hypothetical protein
MQNLSDAERLTLLEAQLLQNLRLMTPAARADLLALSETYVSDFPVTAGPSLSLVPNTKARING